MKLLFENWRGYIIKEGKEKLDSKKITKIVLTDGNKVLIVKRSPHLEKYPGEWDLPGGHAIEGEDLQDALQRETWEETGLVIRNPERVYSQGRYTYFKATLPSENIKLSKEHTEYKIIDIRELSNYKLPEKYHNAVLRSMS